MRRRSCPLWTVCPSLTGISTISPDTSGAIFTSTSGWIFPVAVTSCVTALRKALSVVTGIGLSRLRAATIPPRTRTTTAARPIMRKSRFFDRLGCIAAHYERMDARDVALLELRLPLFEIPQAFEVERLGHFLPRKDGLRHHFPHRRRQFEPVAGAASGDPDVARLRVTIDDEIAVGAVLVLADFRREQRREGKLREPLGQ